MVILLSVILLIIIHLFHFDSSLPCQLFPILNMRKNFFTLRMTEHWNKLLREVVDSRLEILKSVQTVSCATYSRESALVWGLDTISSRPFQPFWFDDSEIPWWTGRADEAIFFISFFVKALEALMDILVPGVPWPLTMSATGLSGLPSEAAARLGSNSPQPYHTWPRTLQSWAHLWAHNLASACPCPQGDAWWPWLLCSW